MHKGSHFCSFTAGTTQSVVNDPLQLAVHAAELAGGPLFKGRHRCGVHPEQKTLGVSVFSHLCQYLIIQCAGVHYGRCRLVTAQNYEQIAYHCGLALLVQINYTVFLKVVQSHLDH